MADTLKTKDSEKLMTEHLIVLRGYARLVIAQGGVLTRDEELDKTARMDGYMACGRSLGFLDSDLYARIFGDMVERAQPKCGCPMCRKREARAGNSRAGGGTAFGGT